MQLLKLLIDTGFVQGELRRYGLDWSSDTSQLLNVYFGEGMHTIWHADRTQLVWDGKQVALEFPWDKWTVFLHPEQRQLVERDFSGRHA